MIPAAQRQVAITLIKEAVSAGAKCYRACEIIGINVRTLRRWSSAEALDDKRQNPAPCHQESALTQQEKDQIIAISNSPEYGSLPASQIVPALADNGVYIASESSFYRVLRAVNMVHRRDRMALPVPREKPDGFMATGPNQVWSWDITYLPSLVRGQFFYLYLIMDLYSRYIVGWEIHANESAEHASVLISKACLRQGISKDQLVLHSDNGSPMKGATMLNTLQRLGIMPSFSRPSVSDDNPYSEALFRTLKYSPAYPSKPFSGLESARNWMQRFAQWYNEKHRHSGIKFVTPYERHYLRDKSILERRKAVYEQAKVNHPARWKGRQTRDWEHEKEVWLNPPKEHQKEPEKIKKIA